MLAIEPHQSLIPAILLIVGLAIFIGTLISIWQNWRDETTQRAARTSALISLAAGLLASAYWAILVEEPMVPLGVVSIPLFFMMPAFLLGYHASSFWLGRSDVSQDQT